MATVDLEKLDWASIYDRLVEYGCRRLGRRGNVELSENLAQEAIRRLLDPKYKDWNPEAEPDAARHLGSVVNGLIRNHFRLKPTQVECLTKTGDVPDQEERGASAEETIAQRELLSGVLTQLLERTQDDELVGELLLLMVDEVFLPREQSEKLNRPIRDIYNARRRLNTHLDAIGGLSALEEG